MGELDSAVAGRRALRALLVCVLLSMAWNGTWFTVEGEGVYVEGLEREPTIWVNYTVDASEEVIEMEITNATPLLHYMNQRESITEPTPMESRCETGCVDRTRDVLALTFALLVLLQVLSIFNPNRSLNWASGGAMVSAGLLLMILIPIASFADFGTDGEDSTGGGFTSGDRDAALASEFAHHETSSELDLTLDGLEVEFRSAGYDLGLIAEENRSAAAETPPADDDAWIAFEGRMTASWGDGILPFLCVPLVWWMLREPSEDEGADQQPSPEESEAEE